MKQQTEKPQSPLTFSFLLHGYRHTRCQGGPTNIQLTSHSDRELKKRSVAVNSGFAMRHPQFAAWFVRRR